MMTTTWNLTILLDGTPHPRSITYPRAHAATIQALIDLANELVEAGQYPDADTALSRMEVPTPAERASDGL